MKFALISDIHANAEALRLVLESLSAHDGVERIYCLGDVVGFHTSPGACIDLLQEYKAECISGNHDAGVTGKLGKEKFPAECWEAIQWTRAKLNSRQYKFLESLPGQATIDRQCRLMHGIFGDPHHYLVGEWKHRYVFFRMKLSGIRFGFYGHIHEQTCFKTGNAAVSGAIRSVDVSHPVPLDDDASWLINPGTVGQPRSADAHARFAIVDLDKKSIDFRKIPYDYSAVVNLTLEIFPQHISMYRRFGFTEEASKAGV